MLWVEFSRSSAQSKQKRDKFFKKSYSLLSAEAYNKTQTPKKAYCFIVFIVPVVIYWKPTQL